MPISPTPPSGAKTSSSGRAIRLVLRRAACRGSTSPAVIGSRCPSGAADHRPSRRAFRRRRRLAVRQRTAMSAPMPAAAPASGADGCETRRRDSIARAAPTIASDSAGNSARRGPQRRARRDRSPDKAIPAGWGRAVDADADTAAVAVADASAPRAVCRRSWRRRQHVVRPFQRRAAARLGRDAHTIGIVPRERERTKRSPAADGGRRGVGRAAGSRQIARCGDPGAAAPARPAVCRAADPDGPRRRRARAPAPRVGRSDRVDGDEPDAGVAAADRARTASEQRLGGASAHRPAAPDRREQHVERAGDRSTGRSSTGIGSNAAAGSSKYMTLTMRR